MRVEPSTILTHIVLCGPLEKKSRQRKPKWTFTPRSVSFCCFRDSRGMLFYDPLPQGHTVIGNIHANRLQKRTNTVEEKRSRRDSVHLLHDSIRPNVAKETHEKLEALSWDTVSHTPYSPDIVASDYRPRRPLKAFLEKKNSPKLKMLKGRSAVSLTPSLSSYGERKRY